MRLRVWLPPLAELRTETALAFEVLDVQRHVRNRGETVIAGLPHGIDCELVLHASDVVLLDVRLPKLSGARLAGALPALVEERVVGDIEASHVVASARDPQGNAMAAIVDRSLLRRALELFQRAGHRVAEATAAPLASPLSSGVWHVRLRDGHGSVRTGPASGMGFSCTGEAPLELRLLVSQTTPKPDAIEVDGDCDVQEWSQALAVPVRAVPASTTAPRVALDLLQYEFSRSVVSWRAWRTTLVLSVALLVAAVAGLNLQAWKLRMQEKSLRERMVSIVKETFTQVPVVLDPLVQMRRYVSDLRTGAGTETSEFTSLAAALGHTADADSVQSIEYRDGHFIVRFRPEATSSDQQRTALAEHAARAGLALSFSSDTAQLARKAGP